MILGRLCFQSLKTWPNDGCYANAGRDKPLCYRSCSRNFMEQYVGEEIREAGEALMSLF